MKFELMTKDECIDFIEFNITGDSENYNKCDEESLYLNSSLFNIFAGCFERSNHLFEFIGQTMYNSRKFIPLQNELNDNLEKLIAINNIGDFQKYLSEIFMGRELIVQMNIGDPDYEKHWRSYIRRWIRINRGLNKMINRCIEEDRVLWVIGY
jgi:hypothetical protein